MNFLVVRPGGDVCIGAWASFSESELFRTLFLLTPCFPEFDRKPPPPSLEDLDVFRDVMTRSGLLIEKIVPMTQYFETPDIETFWSAVKSSFAGMVIFLDGIDATDLSAREVKVFEILKSKVRLWPSKTIVNRKHRVRKSTCVEKSREFRK